MQKYYLTEIVTPDKLIHQGIYFSPEKPANKAILWVHGLTDKFYGDFSLHEEFVKVCKLYGYGYAAFNNRGHDLISSAHKIDKSTSKGYTHVLGGAGYEDFKKSVFDIEAGVEFLTKQGFGEIILIGHSTGANKVCYYAAVKNNPKVSAIILASPLSDRLDPTLDQEVRLNTVSRMEKLIKQGKGDELQSNLHFFPMTAKRYVSLFKQNSVEDQFDYGDKNPKLKCFRKIKKPVLVVLGEKDEYLDRKAGEVAAVFDQKAASKNYKSLIILDALHSFNGKEEFFVKKVIDWINGL